jgi:hypothetical protein
VRSVALLHVIDKEKAREEIGIMGEIQNTYGVGKWSKKVVG